MAIALVGIVGAGTMGSGIAANLAQHGLQVRLHDAAPAQADRAIAFAQNVFARAAERGRMTPAQAEAAAGRITVATELAALRPCQLVIEAVFEDFELKAGLLRELSGVVHPQAVVATNTSCLRVSDLQRHIAGPERFLGLHYFSPAAINPVVEVVKGEATAAATIQAGIAFCGTTGKLPLRCRDSYGFAINRFFCPYTNEAARLLDEGVATPAQIDAAAGEAVGAAAGPFQVMNLIKPRINLHAIRNLAPLGPFYAPARSMAEIGDRDAAWQLDATAEVGAASPGNGAGPRAQIIDRLRAGVFLPVLQLLDEAVATAADVDLGAREALRFTRPPCALMDRLGEADVRRIVAPLIRRHGLTEPKSLMTVGRLGG